MKKVKVDRHDLMRGARGEKRADPSHSAGQIYAIDENAEQVEARAKRHRRLNEQRQLARSRHACPSDGYLVRIPYPDDHGRAHLRHRAWLVEMERLTTSLEDRD